MTPTSKQPNPAWRVTVQRPQCPGDPGYVQVDDVSGGENRWSRGPETLRAEGYDVPDFSALPTGTYTWAEAYAALASASHPSREHLGYFEEFLEVRGDGSWPRGMGAKIYGVSLPADQVGRPLGHAGRRETVLVEDVKLSKGHRTVTYRASRTKPIRVTTMLQRTEGREIR